MNYSAPVLTPDAAATKEKAGTTINDPVKLLYLYIPFLRRHLSTLYLDAVQALYSHADTARFFQDKFLGVPTFMIHRKHLPEGLLRLPEFVTVVDEPVVHADAHGKRHEYFGKLVIPIHHSVLTPARMDALTAAATRSAAESTNLEVEVAVDAEADAAINAVKQLRTASGSSKAKSASSDDAAAEAGRDHALTDANNVMVLLSERFEEYSGLKLAHDLAAGHATLYFTASHVAANGLMSFACPLMARGIDVAYTDDAGKRFRQSLDVLLGEPAEMPADTVFFSGDKLAEMESVINTKAKQGTLPPYVNFGKIIPNPIKL
jgi:hypothetical protein